MKIAIGNDHAAVALKMHIVKYLQEKGQLAADLKARLDAYYELYGATE